MGTAEILIMQVPRFPSNFFIPPDFWKGLVAGLNILSLCDFVLEYTNSIGFPLREALAFVDDCLTGFGIRDKIKIIASGKIITAFQLAKNLSLGADLCNSARGMMLALGVVAVFAEIYSNREFALSQATGPNPDGNANESKHHESPVHNALTKIELPSILFFLGILLAVAALESLGLLFVFATILKETISLDLLMVLFGFASAVIDNVPLVAASLGMFTEFAPDDQLWHFLAYCAGTGGSMLIIGSAAGVVAMGMEKITFGWYLKKILWIALVGYFAGIAVFMLMRNLI